MAAVRWYEARRPGLGAEFYDAVVRTIDRVAELPEAGARFERLDTRRLLIAGFPYQVIYRMSANELRIIAIAHFKRRPGFWRHRR